MAAAFIGYVVFWNLALQLNTVGFYQMMKILVTPAVIVFDYLLFKKVHIVRDLRCLKIAWPPAKTADLDRVAD